MGLLAHSNVECVGQNCGQFIAMTENALQTSWRNSMEGQSRVSCRKRPKSVTLGAHSTEVTAMDIRSGKPYVFTKSGNEVRAIEPTTPYLGQPM